MFKNSSARDLNRYSCNHYFFGIKISLYINPENSLSPFQKFELIIRINFRTLKTLKLLRSLSFAAILQVSPGNTDSRGSVRHTPALCSTICILRENEWAFMPSCKDGFKLERFFFVK